MALTFPNNPTTGQLYTAENNIQYRYDGEKWTTVGAAAISGNITPSDGTVTTAKLVDGAVTAPKLAAGIPVSTLTNDSGYITYAQVGALLGGRNRIINGDMRIDQRFNGSPITFGVGAAYVLDRWQGFATIANNMQFQQVSDAPAGFTNSHKVTALTGATINPDGYFVLAQSVEGYNISDLGFGTTGAQSVTLSFWVKSSVTGTHTGSIRNGAVSRSYPFTYSISSPDTWEKKSVTIPGDTAGTWLTTNGIGLYVTFDLGTGSTYRGPEGSWGDSSFVGATGAVSPMATAGATWLVTGVQLESGTVATPFERRSYGQELALCQRYYEYGGTQLIATGQAGSAFSTTSAFKVTKRAVPTMSFFNTALSNASGIASNSASIHYANIYTIGSTYSTVSLTTDYAASAEL